MAAALVVYETVRVLAVLKAQQEALDHLVAALMVREEAMVKGGLLRPEARFVLTKAGPVWDGFTAGHETIALIDGGCRVEA